MISALRQLGEKRSLRRNSCQLQAISVLPVFWHFRGGTGLQTLSGCQPNEVRLVPGANFSKYAKLTTGEEKGIYVFKPSGRAASQ
jgi:hypothetical protein